MGEAPEEGGDQDGGSTGERRVGEGQLELWHCAKRAYLRKVMQHGVPAGTKPHFKGPSSAAATAAAAAARPQQQSKTMNQVTLQIHHRLIFASTDRQPKCQQSLDSFRRRERAIEGNSEEEARDGADLDRLGHAVLSQAWEYLMTARHASRRHRALPSVIFVAASASHGCV
ncbi:hypothetical protein L1887_53573 [Cichorium endivia]|nr:hypothetical protein L1887_53573 [Cichorium endivia]